MTYFTVFLFTWVILLVYWNEARPEHKSRLADYSRFINRGLKPSQIFGSCHYYGKKFNLGQYHSFKKIKKYLKTFTKKHKDISKLEIIGKSFEKRPLYAVKVALQTKKLISGGAERRMAQENTKRKIICSSLRNQKKKILIICGIHAREWASISFCLYFLNSLITGCKENKQIFQKILKKYDFVIVPLINPDGYEYSRSTDRLWRKTRSKIPGSRCIGVDANRNFYNPGECEDTDPCHPDYCGPKPFSEPEVIAFKRLLDKMKGTLKAYFDIHTFGKLWLIPWGKQHQRPEDYNEMMRVSKIGTEALAKRFNTQYKVGTAINLLYEVKGVALDYVYEKGYTKYPFALELRGKANCSISESCGFLLPEDEIIPTSQETTDGVIATILAMK